MFSFCLCLGFLATNVISASIITRFPQGVFTWWITNMSSIHMNTFFGPILHKVEIGNIWIELVCQVRPHMVTSTIWRESLFLNIYGIEALKFFGPKPTILRHRVITLHQSVTSNSAYQGQLKLKDYLRDWDIWSYSIHWLSIRLDLYFKKKEKK